MMHTAGRTFTNPLFRIAALALLAGLLNPAQGVGAVWSGIRDGTLFARMPEDAELHMRHTPVWGSESSDDLLYFQAPDGELLTRFLIPAGEKEGSARLPSTKGAGDYRFEVTGYSHREVTLEAEPDIPLVFEPAKVHFSARLPEETVLFFKAPEVSPGASFSLRGRYERGGVTGFTLTSPSGRARTLRLDRSVPYDSPSHCNLHIAEGDYEPGVWKVAFQGRGKAAFWLDGIPNLFALSAHDLFDPVYKQGQARLRVLPGPRTPAPLLGLCVLSVNTYPEYESELRSLNPEALNYYVMVNRGLDGARGFKTDPRQTVSVILDPQPGTRFSPGQLEKNLTQFGMPESSSEQGTGDMRLLAIYDEPNLRFSGVDEFIRNYLPLLTALRCLPGFEQGKIAFPESSLILNGPFTANSLKRRGLDWAKALLRDSRVFSLLGTPHAITWHEWMHRDLLRTEYFGRIISLVDEELRPLSPDCTLHVTQTNISPGADSSSYDMDTFFASLWLASSYIHAANSGRLASFNWFAFTDEPGLHKKGLIAVQETEQGYSARRRPVWHAFDFLLQNKRAHVAPLDCPPGEIAALAVAEQGQELSGILIVNQSRRNYEIALEAEELVDDGLYELRRLSADGPDRVVSESVGNPRRLHIMPESINFIELRRQAGQLRKQHAGS